jgi:hypothetical protein
MGGVAVFSAQTAPTPPGTRTIAIQVPIISFLDEGFEQVMDTFQERAAVNTIFLAVFAYGRGVAGRQPPRAAAAGPGKQECDDFHGGNGPRSTPSISRTPV